MLATRSNAHKRVEISGERAHPFGNVRNASERVDNASGRWRNPANASRVRTGPSVLSPFPLSPSLPLHRHRAVVAAVGLPILLHHRALRPPPGSDARRLPRRAVTVRTPSGARRPTSNAPLIIPATFDPLRWTQAALRWPKRKTRRNPAAQSHGSTPGGTIARLPKPSWRSWPSPRPKWRTGGETPGRSSSTPASRSSARQRVRESSA